MAPTVCATVPMSNGPRPLPAEDRGAHSGAAADAVPPGGPRQGAKGAEQGLQRDIKKLCPGDAPGSAEARRCLFQNRDAVGEECSAAWRACAAAAPAGVARGRSVSGPAMVVRELLLAGDA